MTEQLLISAGYIYSVDIFGESEDVMGQWGVESGWDEEEDEFGSNQVQLRTNRRSRGPTDSGTYV